MSNRYGKECRRLHGEYKGLCVGVLNFASAKNPGGGFLNGSMAQEESLAIASAMYVCMCQGLTNVLCKYC